MGNLTEHFSDHEFFCEHCGKGKPKKTLLNLLESIHYVLSLKYTKVRINISGPLRCRVHNRDTKGSASRSRHVFPEFADGSDIKADKYENDTWIQIDPNEVADIAENLTSVNGGVGRYNGRTHVDARPRVVARWDNR